METPNMAMVVGGYWDKQSLIYVIYVTKKPKIYKSIVKMSNNGMEVLKLLSRASKIAIFQ